MSPRARALVHCLPSLAVCVIFVTGYELGAHAKHPNSIGTWVLICGPLLTPALIVELWWAADTGYKP